MQDVPQGQGMMARQRCFSQGRVGVFPAGPWLPGTTSSGARRDDQTVLITSAPSLIPAAPTLQGSSSPSPADWLLGTR